MHAADSNAILEPHELGKHLGTLNYRDMLLVRGRDLDVIAGDRRTDDDHVGASHVLRTMPNEYPRSHFAEAVRHRRRLQVGARDLVAQIEQHLRDAAHTDAADADKMYALDFGKHGRRVSRAVP